MESDRTKDISHLYNLIVFKNYPVIYHLGVILCTSFQLPQVTY